MRLLASFILAFYALGLLVPQGACACCFLGTMPEGSTCGERPGEPSAPAEGSAKSCCATQGSKAAQDEPGLGSEPVGASDSNAPACCIKTPTLEATPVEITDAVTAPALVPAPGLRPEALHASSPSVSAARAPWSTAPPLIARVRASAFLRF